MNFSERINIPPSATVAVNGLAMKKRAAGERVFNLSAGEPMVATHPAIIDAAKCALDADKTNYVPVAGIPELRFVASQFMNRLYETHYTESQTMVTCGGKFGVFSLLQVLLNPGDEALIPAPYWVSYTSMVKLAGGHPVIIDTQERDGWKLSPEQLEASITKKTNVLILNNASNPTGVLYTKEELDSILAVAKKHAVFVISDEVYSGLVYDDQQYISCGSFEQYRDMVAIVQSLSKHFAMTGWRAGLLFAPEVVIKKVCTLQGQSTTGTASITQWAAVAAFEHADDIVTSIRSEMQRRRDVFVGTLNEAFGASFAPPASSLYCFLPLSIFGVSDTDSVAFCTRVLEEANVAMVPGAAFGKEGYVRCSFGLKEEELVGAVEKLKAYFVS